MSAFLGRRVGLWAEHRAADEGGGAGRVWAEFATVWAAVARLPSVRDFGGDKNTFLRRAAATIRKRIDIDVGQRFYWDGAFFDIVSIEADDPREKRLVLIGEEARP